MKSLFLLFCFVILASINLFSQSSKNSDEILRTPKRFYDIQANTLSNVDFISTNYGIFGLDVTNNRGGGFWPRGKQNLYMFASGIWFGALKRDSIGNLRKLVSLSYNPNNGKSWFTPGHYSDKDTSRKNITKFRVYNSTDFNSDGTPKNLADGPNWPLWISDNSTKLPLNSYKSVFINDTNKRNQNDQKSIPSFVSDEDIVAFYKDDDLREYDGGLMYRKNLGYPMNLQVKESLYGWKHSTLKDIVVQVYEIENFSSKDTLFDCNVAMVSDVDIAIMEKAQIGASNDRCRYFNSDTCLRLILSWTGGDYGELGKGFGYLGIATLETPSVDNFGFLKNSKPFYPKSEQNLYTSFRSWTIDQDIPEDSSRYNFMSNQIRDGDNGPGDKRLFSSTGKFHLLPHQKVRFAYAYIFALPAKNIEADGSDEDVTGLKTGFENYCDDIPAKEGSLVKKTQDIINYYYNNLILSIAEQNFQEEYIISPNPASDYILVCHSALDAESKLSPSGGGKEWTVEIYNVFGEIQETSPQTPLLNERGLKIDISNLPDGVYFIKIGDRFEKFVKW